MPTRNKPASTGQRTDLSSVSGRKQRSETSIGHTGSRVEPSHVIERARDTRAKKVARTAATATKAASKSGARMTAAKPRKASGR